jgi:hypothetical protein
VIMLMYFVDNRSFDLLRRFWIFVCEDEATKKSSTKSQGLLGVFTFAC